MLYSLLAGGLISYLITLYLVYEDGPLDIFLKLRKIMGVNIPVTDVIGNVMDYESNGSFTAKLISCHRCTGFWVGIIVGLSLGLSAIGSVAVAAMGVFLHERTK